jgi:histidyl-tRNA synthetase
MNFDKKSTEKLLALSDSELINVIKDIAKEAGIPSENLKIGKSDIIKIRMFLSIASEDDIARLLTQFGGKK